MKNQFFLPLSGGILLMALALMTSCAPLNTSFESAPTLAPGKFELQGNASRTFYAKDDDTPETFASTKNIGVGLGLGVAEHFDFRFRAEAVFIPDYKGTYLDFSRAGYFSFSPKVSFFRNQCLALKGYTSLFIAYERKTRSILRFPDFGLQVLCTPVQTPNFDLTIGCKMGVWAFPSTGLSLGMGVGRDIKRAAFRPVVGMTVGTDEKPVFDMGIGCTVVFDGKKSKK